MKKIIRWIFSPVAGGVVGILGLALAIYSIFFYERKPDLSISIDALSRVFDIYRPVGGLEVFYGGQNLRSSGKNIWVLTATVKNVGNAEIRKGDYDEKVPLGLSIGGAVIAEQPTVKTGVKYIQENLTVSAARDQIVFSPIIMESGDSFEVTALLLGSESMRPSIVSTGKLAGIREIAISGPDNKAPNLSVWDQALGGSSLWVHPIRLVIYFLGFIFILVGGVALVTALMKPFDAMRERRSAAERQRKMVSYKRFDELSRADRYLMGVYAERGKRGLAGVYWFLTMCGPSRSIARHLGDGSDEAENVKIPNRILKRSRVVEELREANLIEGDEIRTAVLSDIEVALAGICEFMGIDVDKLASDVSYSDIRPPGLEDSGVAPVTRVDE